MCIFKGCQVVVLGTSSVWGGVKGETLFSAKQLHDSSTLLCFSLPVCFVLHNWLHCAWSALLCVSPLCSGKTSSVFQSSEGNAVFGGKGKCAPLARGELAYMNHRSGPWLSYPHTNEDSKALQFDWFKRHSPDWSEKSHSGWLELHSSDWKREALSCW